MTPLKCKLLFHKGEKKEQEINSPIDIIKDLRQKQEWLHNQQASDILDLVDLVGKNLASEKKFKFGTNSKYLAKFLSRENLERELNLALRGNYRALDKFLKLEFGGKKLFHAQPRGLAVHWLAGNVDELGVLSLFQTLITKNLSLVKTPKESTFLISILEGLNQINTSNLLGKDILDTISLIYVEKEDIENQSLISKEADIRIAWGGPQATSTITSLPKNFFTEDIVFGPKYSYAIIDENSINRDNKIALKLALDVSIFDQFACSSPHTVFVETTDPDKVKSFAQELAKSMEKVEKLIPKNPISEEKAMEIVRLRAEYEFKGTVFSSEGTNWTVIISDEKGLSQPCFSRTIFVKPIKNASTLFKYNNRKIQTIGVSMDKEKRIEVLDKVTLFGGDRLPPIGEMSYFESPWDGMFPLDRMVRWVSTYA